MNFITFFIHVQLSPEMFAIVFQKKYCPSWVISTIFFFPTLHLMMILIAKQIFRRVTQPLDAVLVL